MIAGLLTDRISIYKNVTTINEYGEETSSWELKTTTRARVTHPSGNREITNGEVFYSYTKTFEVYFYVDVNEYDRVMYNSKYYRILEVIPDRTNNKKVIRAELVDE